MHLRQVIGLATVFLLQALGISFNAHAVDNGGGADPSSCEQMLNPIEIRLLGQVQTPSSIWAGWHRLEDGRVLLAEVGVDEIARVFEPDQSMAMVSSQGLSGEGRVTRGTWAVDEIGRPYLMVGDSHGELRSYAVLQGDDVKKRSFGDTASLLPVGLGKSGDVAIGMGFTGRVRIMPVGNEASGSLLDFNEPVQDLAALVSRQWLATATASRLVVDDLSAQTPSTVWSQSLDGVRLAGPLSFVETEQGATLIWVDGHSSSLHVDLPESPQASKVWSLGFVPTELSVETAADGSVFVMASRKDGHFEVLRWAGGELHSIVKSGTSGEALFRVFEVGGRVYVARMTSTSDLNPRLQVGPADGEGEAFELELASGETIEQVLPEKLDDGRVVLAVLTSLKTYAFSLSPSL